MVPTPHEPARRAASIRVLQFVADTDPDPASDAALALHRRLAEQGIEVRTLALAPGNQPGHEAVLPVIAPSRRSLAARSGVQVERRWADVVVLHGPRSLVAATLPPRSTDVPTVYASPEPIGAAGLGHGGRTAERFTRRLAAVVTTADLTAPSATATTSPDPHGPTSSSVDAEQRRRRAASTSSSVTPNEEPAGERRPEVVRIPIDAAAGAEWAALLRQLVLGPDRRRGG